MDFKYSSKYGGVRGEDIYGSQEDDVEEIKPTEMGGSFSVPTNNQNINTQNNNYNYVPINPPQEQEVPKPDFYVNGFEDFVNGIKDPSTKHLPITMLEMDSRTLDRNNPEDKEIIDLMTSTDYDATWMIGANKQNLTTARAENQGALRRFTNGVVGMLGKTAISAVDSFVNGFISPITFIASVIHSAASEDVDFSDALSMYMWNNSFEKLMQSLEDSLDESTKNYQTWEEQNRDWTKNILTSAFISDGLKSLGYTAGMILGNAATMVVTGGSGNLATWTAKGLKATLGKVGNVIKSAKPIASTAKNANTVVNDAGKAMRNALGQEIKSSGELITNSMKDINPHGNIVSQTLALTGALSEAGMEARHAQKEYLEQNTAAINAKYNAAINNLKELNKPDAEGKKLVLSPEQVQKNIDKLEQQRQQELEKIQKLSNKVGSMSYGLNTLLVAGPNYISFGRYFNNSFGNMTRTAKGIRVTRDVDLKDFKGKAINAVEKTESQLEKAVADVAQNTKGNSLASQLKDKLTDKLKTLKKNQALISTGNGKGALIDDREGFVKGLTRATRNMLMEGSEEMNQNALKEWAGMYYRPDMWDNQMNHLDPKNANDVTGFFETGFEAFKKSWTNFDNYQEFLFGAITGLFPMLGKGKNGKWGLHSSFVDEIKESMEQSKENQSVIKYLQNRFSDDNFKPLARNLINNFAQEKSMQDAINNEDAFGFENSKVNQMLNDIACFESLGMADVYKSLIHNAGLLTDENIQDIIQQSTSVTTDKNGEKKATGAYVHEDGTVFTEQEVRDKVKKTRDELCGYTAADGTYHKGLIDNYVDNIHQISKLTDGVLKNDEVAHLAYQASKKGNFETRQVDVFKELAPTFDKIANKIAKRYFSLLDKKDKTDKEKKELKALGDKLTFYNSLRYAGQLDEEEKDFDTFVSENYKQYEEIRTKREELDKKIKDLREQTGVEGKTTSAIDEGIASMKLLNVANEELENKIKDLTELKNLIENRNNSENSNELDKVTKPKKQDLHNACSIITYSPEVASMLYGDFMALGNSDAETAKALQKLTDLLKITDGINAFSNFLYKYIANPEMYIKTRQEIIDDKIKEAKAEQFKAIAENITKTENITILSSLFEPYANLKGKSAIEALNNFDKETYIELLKYLRENSEIFREYEKYSSFIKIFENTIEDIKGNEEAVYALGSSFKFVVNDLKNFTKFNDIVSLDWFNSKPDILTLLNQLYDKYLKENDSTNASLIEAYKSIIELLSDEDFNKAYLLFRQKVFNAVEAEEIQNKMLEQYSQLEGFNAKKEKSNKSQSVNINQVKIKTNIPTLTIGQDQLTNLGLSENNFVDLTKVESFDKRPSVNPLTGSKVVIEHANKNIKVNEYILNTLDNLGIGEDLKGIDIFNNLVLMVDSGLEFATLEGKDLNYIAQLYAIHKFGKNIDGTDAPDNDFNRQLKDPNKFKQYIGELLGEVERVDTLEDDIEEEETNKEEKPEPPQVVSSTQQTSTTQTTTQQPHQVTTTKPTQQSQTTTSTEFDKQIEDLDRVVDDSLDAVAIDDTNIEEDAHKEILQQNTKEQDNSIKKESNSNSINIRSGNNKYSYWRGSITSCNLFKKAHTDTELWGDYCQRLLDAKDFSDFSEDYLKLMIYAYNQLKDGFKAKNLNQLTEGQTVYFKHENNAEHGDLIWVVADINGVEVKLDLLYHKFLSQPNKNNKVPVDNYNGLKEFAEHIIANPNEKFTSSINTIIQGNINNNTSGNYRQLNKSEIEGLQVEGRYVTPNGCLKDVRIPCAIEYCTPENQDLFKQIFIDKYNNRIDKQFNDILNLILNLKKWFNLSRFSFNFLDENGSVLSSSIAMQDASKVKKIAINVIGFSNKVDAFTVDYNANANTEEQVDKLFELLFKVSKRFHPRCTKEAFSLEELCDKGLVYTDTYEGAFKEWKHSWIMYNPILKQGDNFIESEFTNFYNKKNNYGRKQLLKVGNFEILEAKESELNDLINNITYEKGIVFKYEDPNSKGQNKALIKLALKKDGGLILTDLYSQSKGEVLDDTRFQKIKELALIYWNMVAQDNRYDYPVYDNAPVLTNAETLHFLGAPNQPFAYGINAKTQEVFTSEHSYNTLLNYAIKGKHRLSKEFKEVLYYPLFGDKSQQEAYSMHYVFANINGQDGCPIGAEGTLNEGWEEITETRKYKADGEEQATDHTEIYAVQKDKDGKIVKQIKKPFQNNPSNCNNTGYACQYFYRPKKVNGKYISINNPNNDLDFEKLDYRTEKGFYERLREEKNASKNNQVMSATDEVSDAEMIELVNNNLKEIMGNDVQFLSTNEIEEDLKQRQNVQYSAERGNNNENNALDNNNQNNNENENDRRTSNGRRNERVGRMDSTNEAISTILRTSKGSDRSTFGMDKGTKSQAETERSQKRRQERLIEDWSKNKGIWHNNIEIEFKDKYGEYIKKGGESTVYYDKKNQKAVKVKNTLQYEDLLQALVGIELHNKLFPKTKINITGFGHNSDGFVMILEQDYIPSFEYVSQDNIDKYVTTLKGNFKKTGIEGRFYNDFFFIEDLIAGNVVKTPAGIVVIDAIIKPKDMNEYLSNYHYQDYTNSNTDFARTSDDIFGYTTDGKIFINKDKLRLDTPFHEYTHVWDLAVQRINPELWKRGVELMKQTKEWQEVLADKSYSDIIGDENKIASEVHARLAARMAEDKTREMAKEHKKGFWQKLVDWFKQFNKCILENVFNMSKEEVDKVTLDDFLNAPISDFFRKTDPRKFEKQEAKQEATPAPQVKENKVNIPKAPMGFKKLELNLIVEDQYYNIDYPKEDVTKAEQWLNNTLPQFRGKLEIVKGLIKVAKNKNAFGQFNDGIIKLSDLALSGTIYHEAFHAVLDSLLTQRELDELMVEAEEYFNKTGIELEEEMAEEFRKFMLDFNNKSLVGRVKTFFHRLREIVKNWFNCQSKVEALYWKIADGFYASREKVKKDNYEPKHVVNTIKKDRYDYLTDFQRDRLTNIGFTRDDFYNMKPDLLEALLNCN